MPEQQTLNTLVSKIRSALISKLHLRKINGKVEKIMILAKTRNNAVIKELRIRVFQRENPETQTNQKISFTNVSIAEKKSVQVKTVLDTINCNSMPPIIKYHYQIPES